MIAHLQNGALPQARQVRIVHLFARRTVEFLRNGRRHLLELHVRHGEGVAVGEKGRQESIDPGEILG